MKRLLIISTFIFLILNSLQVFAANPCKPIAEACMQLGFYKGGNTVGKGLVENCVLPVVNGQKTLNNGNFSAETMQQCKTMLQSKGF